MVREVEVRNYAAQAERGLKRLASKVRENRPDLGSDANQIDLVAERIGGAVHFVIPDGGMIFDDRLRGLKGGTLRLPFPSVTIEYYMPPGGHIEEAETPSKKRLIMAEEIEGKIFCAVVCEIADQWMLMPLGWIFFPENWELRASGDLPLISGKRARPSSEPFTGTPLYVLPGFWAQGVRLRGEAEAHRAALDDIGGELRSLLEFCEALTCSNVSAPIVRHADAAKNARRVRDGKLPFYETRMLMVDVSTKSDRGGRDLSADASRSGPRQHLRRGHIRILADGRKVWVTSCSVGARENGVIDKQYGVLRPARSA